MTTRTTLDTHIIKNNGAVCYLAKSRVATSGSGDDSVELKSSSSSGVDKTPTSMDQAVSIPSIFNHRPILRRRPISLSRSL
jgi:hypothetical protein